MRRVWKRTAVLIGAVVVLVVGIAVVLAGGEYDGRVGNPGGGRAPVPAAPRAADGTDAATAESRDSAGQALAVPAPGGSAGVPVGGVDRSLVRSATVTVEVGDPAAAGRQVRTAVAAAGGFVAQEQSGTTGSWLVLRVPADGLDRLLADIGALGVGARDEQPGGRRHRGGRRPRRPRGQPAGQRHAHPSSARPGHVDRRRGGDRVGAGEPGGRAGLAGEPARRAGGPGGPRHRHRRPPPGARPGRRTGRGRLPRRPRRGVGRAARARRGARRGRRLPRAVPAGAGRRGRRGLGRPSAGPAPRRGTGPRGRRVVNRRGEPLA